MLTLSETGSGTGRSNCLINNLSMRFLAYSLLSNEYLATIRAMLTFGKSGCRTGSLYCSVDNLVMTERINVRVYYNVTAMAGVSSIAVQNTGGSGNYGFIAMSC